ncbi:MAG: response regulator [Candidatus Eisenbacteria bacterium]|nr:response regulator [Candidatus Latescibacterota bacterium]MBD3302686.1 response regulator [Candidatus Eisenbacteria bacterium]
MKKTRRSVVSAPRRGTVRTGAVGRPQVQHRRTSMGASDRKHRILVAEDDPTNQYVFRAILEAAGHETVVVDNGLQALETARDAPPDLFLMDMMMPVMDGYETAWRIIQDSLFDEVPIIALTARAMDGDAERTLRAGCDDYLAKPIRRQEFLDKVSYWLERPSSEWMPGRLARRVPQRESA